MITAERVYRQMVRWSAFVRVDAPLESKELAAMLNGGTCFGLCSLNRDVDVIHLLCGFVLRALFGPD